MGMKRNGQKWKDKEEGDPLVTDSCKGQGRVFRRTVGINEWGYPEEELAWEKDQKFGCRHVNFEMRVGYPVANVHETVGKVDQKLESGR